MRSNLQNSGEYPGAHYPNQLRSDAGAAGALLVHQQIGSIALPNNPSNTNTLTLTVNGTAVTVTFVSSIGSTPGNVLIAGSAALTLANLLFLLQNPQTTTANGVAFSSANETLIRCADWQLNTTTVKVLSHNNAVYAPLTSFSASTTASGGSYTANTMALYVEAGNYWLNGTRVVFTGGSTGTVVAPAANPRIDLVCIDNTGTLSITTGVEGASPAVPTYPSNKIVLAEVFNRVGETKLLDYDDSTNGYVQNDVRSFLTYLQVPTAIAINYIPDADNTRDLGSSSKTWANVYAKQVWQNGALAAAARFGGTGADGALTITSGTTTVSFASASYIIKNYSSISITGTGALGFSTKHANGSTAILKSSGVVTLTSSATPNIDLRLMGADAQTSAIGPLFGTRNGKDGTTGQVGGLGGLSPLSSGFPFLKGLPVGPGAGGGQGSTNNSGGGTVGTPGKGGGGLYIECAGALNFTATIDTSGQNATNPTGSGSSANGQSAGGGGSSFENDGVQGGQNLGGGSTNKAAGAGGGGAGKAMILANSITANSGTFTSTGGTGGVGDNGATGGVGGATTGYSALNADIV